METLEGQRLATNNSITTPIKHGIYMAFGSDNLPIGPMVGLYAAVTRKGESGKVYGPGEAVSIKDAITMYTRNGAFLTREEKLKGTLEAGKLADMIVLPEDPLQISPDKMLGLKVDMTIVGGRILYDRHSKVEKRVLESRIQMSESRRKVATVPSAFCILNSVFRLLSSSVRNTAIPA